MLYRLTNMISYLYEVMEKDISKYYDITIFSWILMRNNRGIIDQFGIMEAAAESLMVGYPNTIHLLLEDARRANSRDISIDMNNYIHIFYYLFNDKEKDEIYKLVLDSVKTYLANAHSSEYYCSVNQKFNLNIKGREIILASKLKKIYKLTSDDYYVLVKEGLLSWNIWLPLGKVLEVMNKIMFPDTISEILLNRKDFSDIWVSVRDAEKIIPLGKLLIAIAENRVKTAIYARSSGLRAICCFRNDLERLRDK